MLDDLRLLLIEKKVITNLEAPLEELIKAVKSIVLSKGRPFYDFKAEATRLLEAEFDKKPVGKIKVVEKKPIEEPPVKIEPVVTVEKIEESPLEEKVEETIPTQVEQPEKVKEKPILDKRRRA